MYWGEPLITGTGIAVVGPRFEPGTYENEAGVLITWTQSSAIKLLYVKEINTNTMLGTTGVGNTYAKVDPQVWKNFKEA
jgi:hypothetical protein